MARRKTAPSLPGAVIVWFRRDLRLTDHPALDAAAQAGLPLLPVFILPETGRPPGAASRWWLHGSLAALGASLQERGSTLILRAGDPVELLRQIASTGGATALYFNRSWEPSERETEERVARTLAGTIEVRAFPGDALHEPGAVLSAAGEPLRVFTPFWRACLRQHEPPAPARAPGTWRHPGPLPASDCLDDWCLRPSSPDWAAGLRQRWRPGEHAAGQALDAFIDSRLRDYPRHRDRPALPGTSALSAHLHFGEIGPRQVWHALSSVAAGDSRLGAGTEAFLRQLGWREFSLHLLHFWPDLPTTPFRPEFRRFPWRSARAALRRWQRGETGYPLVDAGMRELWATGWMHNRVRMIVASFLVKHLLIHWREGESWFWDTLVDADLANNAANWQWVAGCGADAAPYFRIFNPVLQGRRFDPQGDYVRRWLPELARLADRHIHAPWQANTAELTAAGVTLGRNYPKPIVDHHAARERALAAYSALKASAPRAPGKFRRPRSDSA